MSKEQRRLEIINDMCLTWRHDYGFLKEDGFGRYYDYLLSSSVWKHR